MPSSSNAKPLKRPVDAPFGRTVTPTASRRSINEKIVPGSSTHLWIPPCQAVFDRMRACDRMQSFIRPQRCGDLMAAGRYGYAQRRVQIKFESLQLFGLVWFSRSGSLRSFSHAIRRHPHTSRAPGRGVARAALTPSPPDLDNSPASSACVPLLASNGWVGVSIPSSSAFFRPK